MEFNMVQWSSVGFNEVQYGSKTFQKGSANDLLQMTFQTSEDDARSSTNESLDVPRGLQVLYFWYREKTSCRDINLSSSKVFGVGLKYYKRRRVVFAKETFFSPACKTSFFLKDFWVKTLPSNSSGTLWHISRFCLNIELSF